MSEISAVGAKFISYAAENCKALLFRSAERCRGFETAMERFYCSRENGTALFCCRRP